MARAKATETVDAPRIPVESIKLVGDLVLLELPAPKEKTKSGIILPDSVRDSSVMDPSNMYKVVSIGPDVKNVKVGDVVLANNQTMSKLPFMGMGEKEEFAIVRDDNYGVLMVFDADMIKKAKASADLKESLVQ